jgi:hypothetical protein
VAVAEIGTGAVVAEKPTEDQPKELYPGAATTEGEDEDEAGAVGAKTPDPKPIEPARETKQLPPAKPRRMPF